VFNSAPRHKSLLGEWRYSSTHSLTSALDGGEWSASCPGHFTPRERAPDTHWIGGWVGPRAVLNAVVKRKIPSPRRESNSRTPIVHLVAQRYTDWTIAALASVSTDANYEITWTCVGPKRSYHVWTDRTTLIRASALLRNALRNQYRRCSHLFSVENRMKQMNV
jgi:hypothetical protein